MKDYKELLSDNWLLENENKILYRKMKILFKLNLVGTDRLFCYLHKYGYEKIILYGMNEIGIILSNMLKDKINIVRVDKSQQLDRTLVLPILHNIENVDSADLVIVCAIARYAEIKTVIRDKINCPIVSVEDVMYEVEHENS